MDTWPSCRAGLPHGDEGAAVMSDTITLKVPTDAAFDAVNIIMHLMKDHPHMLVISGEAIEEMRNVYNRVKEANNE